jgi:hypothetical protein
VKKHHGNTKMHSTKTYSEMVDSNNQADIEAGQSVDVQSFCGENSTSDMSTFSTGSASYEILATLTSMRGEAVSSPGGAYCKRKKPRRRYVAEDTLEGDSLHLTRRRIPGRRLQRERKSGSSKAESAKNSSVVAEYFAPLKDE